MATFITSKSVGQTISIYTETSTGYWKYNHNGLDSSVFTNGMHGGVVSNANGEFTIISCDATGNPSGYATNMALFTGNQVISFDGTGLSGLTNLSLGSELQTFNGGDMTQILNYGSGIGLYFGGEQLTSFDGGNMIGLTNLDLRNKHLTSFDGGNMIGLTSLVLYGNQLTSFNGTGLSSLTELALSDNQLTSFNGAGLSNLTSLELYGNQLTSFSGTGLSSLTYLNLGSNQLTSINGDGLSSLTRLYLSGNDLTSLDDFILPTSLTYLGLYMNPLLTSFDLSYLTNLNELSLQSNQLTSFSTNDYILPNSLTILDLASNQFTSFDGAGLSGLTSLGLSSNPLTSFDGTGLSGLTILSIEETLLTSFDGAGLSSLTELQLYGNQLMSFNGTGLSSLTYLNLVSNQLTSFDGAGLSSLTNLSLENNQLTSFNGDGLSNLTSLGLYGNPLTTFNGGDMSQITNINLSQMNITTLTSFDGGNMIGLTNLDLSNNQLTSFNGTGLSSLTHLVMSNNQLNTFDGTGLSSLNILGLAMNQLTSLDVTSLSSLTILDCHDNPITSLVNNQILTQLNQHGVSGGEFYSSNGRTAASNTDYNNLLNNLGWYFEGLDLIAPPVVGNGKLRVRGVIVEPSLVLPTTLEPNDSIDGYIGTSTGYIKVSYWDGTTEILGNGTPDNKDFSYSIPFSKTVSSDDTYSQRTVTINSCDVSGAARGNILTVQLNNSKFSSVNISNLSELLAFGISRPFTCNKNLTKVKTAYISQQESTSIDLTIFPQIDMVMIDSAPNLVSINASGLLSLNQFYVRYNPNLTSIDLTDSVNLMVASFETNNKLSSIIGITSGTIIPNIQVLTIKQCDFIDSIDLSNMNILTNLTIHGMDKYDENTGQWTVLPAPIVVNNMPIGLTTLNLNNSSENYLDFSRFPNLASLDVNSSLAETIDLGSFNGGYLVIGNNDLLTTLDTTGVVNISGVFHMSSNDLLSSLDVQSIAEVYNGNNFRLENNALITSSVIDDLLIAFDSVGKNGKMFYSNVLRTSVSNAAKANLINKGWSLYGLGGLMQ